MRMMGVLEGEQRTRKGGHHWVYRPAMDEAQFKQFVATMLLSNLMSSFPEETKKTLRQLPT